MFSNVYFSVLSTIFQLCYFTTVTLSLGNMQHLHGQLRKDKSSADEFENIFTELWKSTLWKRGKFLIKNISVLPQWFSKWFFSSAEKSAAVVF